MGFNSVLRRCGRFEKVSGGRAQGRSRGSSREILKGFKVFQCISGVPGLPVEFMGSLRESE